MTRLKRRRKRIQKVIKFFLQVVRNGEWTSSDVVIRHLNYSDRGSKSHNSLTPSGLGQMVRGLEMEKRTHFEGNRRIVQYRILGVEEE